jgi:hypothetical protein
MHSIFAAALALLLATPTLAADLPNPNLTPGVARTDLTLDQICTTKWGRDVRVVSGAMKRKVFEAYRLTDRSTVDARRRFRMLDSIRLCDGGYVHKNRLDESFDISPPAIQGG